MPKNKQRKKDQKLRQSIEVLKAQLKVEPSVNRNPGTISNSNSSVKISSNKMDMVDDKFIKRDLTKTIVLSSVSFSVIITLWLLNITSFPF